MLAVIFKVITHTVVNIKAFTGFFFAQSRIR